MVTADVDARGQIGDGPASSEGEARILRSARELRAHLDAPGKREAYRAFLVDLGVDPDAVSVRGYGERPAVLFAEQPGTLLTPRDVIRARLLEQLVERCGFDPMLSGLRSLPHDRFTGEGDKGMLLDFALHSTLGPVRLVGSSFLKKHDHKTYSSLRLADSSYSRLKAIWDYSLLMLEAASESPQRFADVVGEIFRGSPTKGARDILPAVNDPRELERIGRELSAYRLELAFKTLWPARAHLRKGVAWDGYWSGVNGEFLGLPVESLSPVVARLLLAVRDPLRLGRRLAELSEPTDGLVSVAGLVDDHDTFRTVHFDAATDQFLIESGRGGLRPIEWEAVRLCAIEGRGGRPSGMLEYLLLAAFGFYLLVATEDTVQPFHEAACRIHRRATGVDFPWIAFTVPRELERDGSDFLGVFRPDFPAITVGVFRSFFDA